MSIADMSKLSFFKVGKYQYDSSYVCDYRNIPRPHFCMGLIIKGTGFFEASDGDKVEVVPEDIIFVPITSKYISHWKGEEILYISMHFAFEPLCGISENNNFALQKVTLPQFSELKKKFIFAFENYKGKDEINWLL